MVKTEFRCTVGRLELMILLGVKNTETLNFANKAEGLSECEGEKKDKTRGPSLRHLSQ